MRLLFNNGLLIQNVALFNFEPEALGSNLRAECPSFHKLHGFGSKAIALVDPLSRCAAIPLNGFQIAVIPFDTIIDNVSQNLMNRKLNDLKQERSKDLASEAEVALMEESRFKQAKAVRRVAMSMSHDQVWEMSAGSYLIDLVKIGNIPSDSLIHMAFLHEQNGIPVVALLHFGWIRSSTNRAAITRWAVHLTAITVSKYDTSVVWCVTKLPSDSFAVVPTSTGGILVLSQNCIHHVVGGSVKRKYMFIIVYCGF